MQLETDELVRINDLIKRTKSKWRRWLSIFLTMLLALLFIVILIGSLLGFWEIKWKEIWWIGLIFMAFIVALKAVYDIQRDLKYTLNIIEKGLKEDNQDSKDKK